jgi:hypothetical protein
MCRKGSQITDNTVLYLRLVKVYPLSKKTHSLSFKAIISWWFKYRDVLNTGEQGNDTIDNVK